MRTARKLTVRSESLGELSAEDLGSVAGASIVSQIFAQCPSNIVGGCPTHYGPICDPISRAMSPCITDNC